MTTGLGDFWKGKEKKERKSSDKEKPHSIQFEKRKVSAGVQQPNNAVLQDSSYLPGKG